MSVADFFKSRLFVISLVVVIVAATLPLYVSGYILGLLTVAYYFGVFAMAWDLLFGFAGEVNFGPTFLIGVGAYTAGILNNQYGWSVYLCIVLGAMASVIAGFVLALPALRVRGPYFGLTTLVAVLMLQNFIVVFDERDHTVWTFALAGRSRAASQRARSRSGGSARFQHRQTQARSFCCQRILLGSLWRTAGVLFWYGISRNGR
jgi:hypothetical protein